jgi:TAG lipase/steryl ester hydrolase/phospholipase A2/LPA acyltransferase
LFPTSYIICQYLKLIQNPTYVDLQKAANQGRRCTWEKLSAIKANCGIELALDECVAVLNHMHRLKRSAERAASSSHGLANSAKFSASKRIPSWNCIAREVSVGSIEEDFLTDVASSFHQEVSASTRGQHSGKNLRSHGSDSETENVDFDSWTRSGGPLMRTISADKYIESIQNVGTDANNQFCHSPRLTSPDKSSESTEIGYGFSADGSSIIVTEGDLLQTERIHNGIVFNVVKKESLTRSTRSLDMESFNNDVPECLQLDCRENEIDASSTSDYGDDNVTVTSCLNGPDPDPTSMDHSGIDDGINHMDHSGIDDGINH